MFVFYSLLIAGLTAASAVPLPSVVGLASRDTGGGTCVGPDFTNTTVVGAPGPFACESDWGQGYLPITNLTFWSDYYSITAFQVIYSDGTVGQLHGTNSAFSQVTHLGINYGQGDKFTTANLYGYIAYAGSQVYTIGLQTIKGGSLTAGQSPNVFLTHVQDPGIGILFGVQYSLNTAGALQSLGFVFLEPPITEIQITDIQFPDGPVGSNDSIYPRTIGKAHFYNNATEPQTYQFNNQVSMTQAYTFMQAVTLSFTVMEAIAFTFQFEILGISGSFTSTTTFVWEASETTTFSAAFTNTQQVQYNTQVSLDPGEGVDCFAVVGQGAGTFFYTSLVTLSLKNGNSYTFPENGYVTVQAVSEGEAACNQADHP